MDIEISFPSGLHFVSFTRGQDWLQGNLVYHFDTTFQFGGLVGKFNNPGRVHLGDLVLEPVTIGKFQFEVTIKVLSEKSTTIQEIGSLIGSQSASTQGEIVVYSSRRSVENTFYPVERRAKRNALHPFGDINSDGTFDLNDALFLLLNLPDLSLTEDQLLLADLDLNGDINSNDVSYDINF